MSVLKISRHLFVAVAPTVKIHQDPTNVKVSMPYK